MNLLFNRGRISYPTPYASAGLFCPSNPNKIAGVALMEMMMAINKEKIELYKVYNKSHL